MTVKFKLCTRLLGMDPYSPLYTPFNRYTMKVFHELKPVDTHIIVSFDDAVGDCVIYCRVMGSLGNNELERMWKESVVI